ncbi:helix-turn-helix domain-containing protein [Microbacterium sp. STN6]|uniref:AraC family transcriptional regulator n=1 Tax=Microbacterium sp. STN6 TaxID=2995588 RepID=UPI002260FA07|nr:helix-turn-helix domain-containing protein [Microbacterium sp. STN6]MCX7521109.1 helix-turn-helix domain-containing protein [Microbacterium sp. STN6]
MTDAGAAPRSHGHLNPGHDAVRFDRFDIGAGTGELVRHVWVVRWSIPPEAALTQRVLTYPAVNVVVMPGGARLHGPDPRVQSRVLEGSSWAVGVLFRPAAAALLSQTPARVLVRGSASGEPIDAPVAAIEEAMALEPDRARMRLVGLLRAWLVPLAARVDERGLLVNRLCRLAEEDESIVRTAQLAERAGIGVRTLERLVRERVGVTPKWLIECRRLQRAATALFAGRDELSDLAAELGYADYAHFSRRYAAVLDETPAQTRRAGELARVRG